MSDFEQPVEPMSRAEAILRKYGDVTPMSRVEDLLKELVDESGGSDVTVTPVLSDGVRLATIGVDGTDYNIYAPEDVVGSIVSVTTEYNTGTLLATITVNDVDHYIYVPEANNILSGTYTPSANVGEDNDIFIKYDGVNTESTYTRIASISMDSGQYKKTVAVDLTPDYYHLRFSNAYGIGNSITVLKQDVYPDGSVTLHYGTDDVTFTINGNSISVKRSEYNGNAYNIYATTILDSTPTGVNTPYAKLKGTWFPFPDKGNVEDVYINGTSVLDENDIAQIKSYQEITKAEYDALPASKLTDDILYCITDGGATKPGEYFNPVIYSTTEREVGVWTDGKPLYQKTVEVTSIASNVWNSYLVDADAVIKNIDGWYGDANNNLPLNYFNGSVMMVRTSDHSDGYFSLYGNGTLSKATVTVQYTKTTDTPGSGKYTTLGVPSANLILDAQIYSLEEKQVGVWTDGKPIYKKTWEFSNLLSVTERWTETSVKISDFNIKNIIDVMCNDNDISSWRGGVLANADTSASQYIRLLSTRNSGTCGVWKMTLWYTKTTDTAGSGGYQAYGFSPIIYSDTEREVGVWKDNKPLYQKTIDIGTLPNNNQKLVNHNINDFGEAVRVFGYARNTSNNAVVPLPHNHPNAANQSISLIVTTTQISVQTGVDGSGYVGCVTVQYTKASDVAGSGEYNTLAIPNVHYSTNEQVIGTWIDGKTLYQKTVTVQNNVAWSDNATFDNTISDADTIWIYDGYIYDGRSATNIIYPNPIIQPTDRGGFTIDISDKTKFKFKSSTTFSVNSSRYAVLTVRYTKTTD